MFSLKKYRPTMEPGCREIISMTRKLDALVDHRGPCMMLIIWALLITSTICHEVTETQEDTTDNITTLYPVPQTNQTKDSNATSTKIKTDATWKIETSFTENFKKEAGDGNRTESKEEPVIEKPSNDSKEFKPSVHLGNFFDEDSFGIVPIPTRPTLDAFTPLKKPPSAFYGSSKDDFRSIIKKIPKDSDRFPYKFEDAILTRAKSKWRPAASGLESKPTMEVPVKVPAGGLYKKPDAFKEKPGFSGDDEEFGLEFNGDVKDNFIQKRPNPWRSLLHLITAFIPVGLIISALTPNVITVHSTGPAGGGFGGPNPLRPQNELGPNRPSINEPLPPRLYRRSSALAPISERCRRRLLCELHADANYQLHDSSQKVRGRACSRLRCDEPDALAHTLAWLFAARPHNT